VRQTFKNKNKFIFFICIDLEDSTTSGSPSYSQLCEHEPSISKQIKNQAMLEPTGLSNMTTTTINNLNSNTNSFCTSLMFQNQLNNHAVSC
jgi:hypothetical protein